MRNRTIKRSSRARAIVRTPLRIEISHEEILTDLLYPAPARRSPTGVR